MEVIYGKLQQVETLYGHSGRYRIHGPFDINCYRG